MFINNCKLEMNHGAENSLQEMLRLKKESYLMSSPTNTKQKLIKNMVESNSKATGSPKESRIKI